MTKYTPYSESTVKVHMHTQKSNIRSTKMVLFGKNMSTALPASNTVHIIPNNEESYDDIFKKT